MVYQMNGDPRPEEAQPTKSDNNCNGAEFPGGVCERSGIENNKATSHSTLNEEVIRLYLVGMDEETCHTIDQVIWILWVC